MTHVLAGVIIESLTPVEVTVVDDGPSSHVLVGSSIDEEASSDPTGKPLVAALSKEGKEEQSISKDRDDGGIVVNRETVAHTSKDSGGPTLVGRWEKADESRGNKRKEPYRSDQEAKRNFRQHHNRRSY